MYVATKKKDFGAKRFLRTRITFSLSMMTTIGVSKADYKDSIFVNLGMKIDEIYYCDVFLSQQLLSAISIQLSDKFICQDSS